MSTAMRARPQVVLPPAVPIRAVDEVVVSGQGDRLEVSARRDLGVADHPYLAAHFPSVEIYPGVFVLETVRQAVAAALCQPAVTLVEVQSMRLRAPWGAGDEISVSASVELQGTGGTVRARCGRRDGSEGARLRASFSFAPPGHPEPPPGHPGPQTAAPAPRQGECAWPAPAAVLDVPALRRLLPHGHPMLLLDRVEAIVPRRVIHARKAVTASEPCYGQVGGDYRYPASLLLESLGQAAAVLWRAGEPPAGGETAALLLAAVRGFRMLHPVYPGDVLEHRVGLEAAAAATAFASGGTWVGGRQVAAIDLLAAAVRPVSSLGLAPRASSGGAGPPEPPAWGPVRAERTDQGRPTNVDDQ